MGDYAQIIDGADGTSVVNMIVVEDDDVMADLNAAGLEVYNVTDADPKPQTGWGYVGGEFIEP